MTAPCRTPIFANARTPYSSQPCPAVQRQVSITMSSKLLFNLPRQTVPIFVRRTGPATGAAAGAVGGAGDDETTSSSSGASSWARSDMEFPVRRVYCVGRNYREHAIEMGGNPDREPPFFFQKPADAVVICDPQASSAVTRVPYPTATSSLHYEGELIVAIDGDGSHIPVDDAMDHVYGYAVGCDLTRRDLQSEAKRGGRPWDAAKGFDRSCPMSPIIPKDDIDLSGSAVIRLNVNESVRQQSAIGNMIYSVPEIISNLSQLFRLLQGDLILTGTPAGVSELNVGDSVSISCGGLIPCQFEIGDPQ